MSKKIFIGLSNTSGYGTRLAKGFSSIGVNADLYLYSQHIYKYDNFNTYFLKKFNNKWLNRVYIRLIVLKCLFKYDAFIFFSSDSLMKNYKDFKYFRRFGKRIMMIFCGCDVQQPELTFRADIPFSACHNCTTEYKNFVGCIPETKKIRTRIVENSVDFIVSHPAFSDALTKNYISTLYPINVEEFPEKVFKPNNNKPVILHAPSNFGYKGTQFLLEAVEKLRNEYDFDFRMVNNITIDELYKEISKADLIVDQLIQGWPGLLPLEAMMYEKPVICYLRDDVLKSIPPNCPMINANPDTIYNVLKNLLNRRNEWDAIGKKGREYVEKYHNASVIAKSYYDLLID